MPRVTNRQGAMAKERMDWIYYDSVTLGASDTLATLFQIPYGQAGKKLADTNLKAAGVLPGKQKFQIRAITMHAEPDVTRALLTALMKSGAIDIKVGEKSYLQVPIQRITSGCGMDGLTTGTSVELYHNGVADPAAIFSLDEGIDVEIDENFQVEMSWLTAPGAVKFWVCLEGKLERAVQ